MPFFFLFESLFRSIGGGKFEKLYKELLNVLPGLLNGLVTLQSTCQRPILQKLLIELCLTVPARLPSLLKHLGLLMKPVILALESPHSGKEATKKKIHHPTNISKKCIY